MDSAMKKIMRAVSVSHSRERRIFAYSRIVPFRHAATARVATPAAVCSAKAAASEVRKRGSVRSGASVIRRSSSRMIAKLMRMKISKKYWRLSARCFTASRLASSTLSGRGVRRQEVERYGDDRVDGQELDSFVPVRLSIHDQIGEDRNGERAGQNLEGREEQIERM